MSYPMDKDTEKECPFCCEYGIDKNIEFINRDDLKFLFDGFAYDTFQMYDEVERLERYNKLQKKYKLNK